MRRNDNAYAGADRAVRELRETCGDMFIRDLRRSYGPQFAFGKSDYVHLDDVLPDLDEPSLAQLKQDFAARH